MHRFTVIKLFHIIWSAEFQPASNRYLPRYRPLPCGLPPRERWRTWVDLLLNSTFLRNQAGGKYNTETSFDLRKLTLSWKMSWRLSSFGGNDSAQLSSARWRRQAAKGRTCGVSVIDRCLEIEETPKFGTRRWNMFVVWYLPRDGVTIDTVFYLPPTVLVPAGA